LINHNGTWKPEALLGVPILIVVITLLAMVTGLLIWKTSHPSAAEYSPFADGTFWLVGWIVPAALLGVIIGAAAGYWPYHGDYHRLQPATGTVTAVDSRFLAASQYVVVTYNTGLIVRCDDSRCATVKPGDQLRLLCTKQHQFGSPESADGWGCRWGQ
jgi:hypothetical protein